MRSYLVILTGSQTSWQAAFTGYDLAVRGGARLIGAIPFDPDRVKDPDRLLAEFDIGARAAGASFTNQQVSLKSGKLAGDLPAGLRGVLIGRSDLSSERELNTLLESLPCPLWIIQRRRPLVHALGILERASAPWFKPVAEQIAHDWGLQLETIDVGPSSTREGGDPARQPNQDPTAKLEVSLSQFTQRLSAEPADLTLLGWPSEAISSWELLHRSDRPLILIPAP
jgi:hypothetical protein